MKLRHTFIHATALALAIAAVPVLAQTQTTETVTTTTVKKGTHEYIYYGDHDIYFAPDTKTYYWQEGGNWRSGIELPTESRTYITRGGVKIQLDTERPYERNEWVVEHYKHHHDNDDD
jgi:hypothetical protein